MNFLDLMTKMKAIDEGSELPVAPTKDDQGGAGASDEDVDECGGMGIIGGPMGAPPKQQDSVSLNVTAQGAGGIRDLMDILHNLEGHGGSHDEPADQEFDGEPLFGAEDEIAMLVGDGYENSIEGGSEPEVYGIDAVTQTGNDLSSHGGHEVEKVAGGGNPYSNVDESLVQRLASMYEEIKESSEKKTMSRAAKGNEKYGKDGMKALAKAGREGKDLDKIRDKYNKYD
jgi:hypothetical protein